MVKKAAPAYDLKSPDQPRARTAGANSDSVKFLDRIERLEEEKKALGGDIREVYSEAKSGGFDAKIMRQVVRIRKLDKAERQEQEALLQVYLDAVGD